MLSRAHISPCISPDLALEDDSEMPSCSQVDPSVLREIGGDWGERLRRSTRTRRQRAASVAAAEAAQLEDEQQRRRQQRPSHATITAVAAEHRRKRGA